MMSSIGTVTVVEIWHTVYMAVTRIGLGHKIGELQLSPMLDRTRLATQSSLRQNKSPDIQVCHTDICVTEHVDLITYC